MRMIHDSLFCVPAGFFFLVAGWGSGGGRVGVAVDRSAALLPHRFNWSDNSSRNSIFSSANPHEKKRGKIFTKKKNINKSKDEEEEEEEEN